MKNKALAELKRYAIMTLGCFIYAISIAIFLDPKGLAPGGVTGISIMVSYATNIPTGTLVLLINIPLLAIGVWKFGRQFLCYTVFSTVLSSLMINGLAGVVVPTDDQLLCGVVGGALMGLGIERELIGDIVLREAGAYIFCVERMVDFICQSLVQIGRTDVRCERAEPPQGALRETREVRLQVSSPRLDAIAAHLFHLSRGDAQQLFRQGRVMVDDAPCERPDYQLRDGQVISVRGYGRAQYLGVDGQSKKGKDVVRIALYS